MIFIKIGQKHYNDLKDLINSDFEIFSCETYFKTL